ncbi:MAG TPA: DUF4389 domain-containing protein [Gaiellaceae bacterium]|nr:DUF4389 domain-containing protein [Gaiellaceae bacterium]
MPAPSPHPVSVEGRLEPELSRWLWLVKWLLAIPHYIVLFFLGIAFVLLTIVAFFAILFTGRYPRGIFDFNVGVLRWTWRVSFYSYGALGTDRYPPFTLDEAPDYPATLEVVYPVRLSRGLVLVKWWLLAIPHYILLGIFLGGAGSAAGRADDWGGWHWWYGGGLIWALVVFAGIALLFLARYPRGLFDFVLGLDRWVARVVAYAGLMTDAYPPFRLDQGGDDPAGAAVVAAEAPTAPEAIAAPGEPPPAAQTIAAQPAAAPRPRGGAGRVVLIVVGVIAALLSLALLAGGTALVVVDQTQRDEDGFLMSPSEDFSTATYAIVSESADVDFGGSESAARAILGDVRIRSESDRDVFVGIARDTDVEEYLNGVEHSVVTDIGKDPEYSDRPGGAPTSSPGDQDFWVASTSGSGEQTLEWQPEDGSWSAVVMNSDASRGVASELSIGAELDAALWVGIVLLVVGALLAALAALAITSGARRRATPSAVS